MSGDAEQDVPEVPEGLDPGELASLRERVEDRGPARSLQAAGEEPVLPADCHDPQLVFRPVVVRLQPPVEKGAPEIFPRVVHASQRLSQPRLRQRRAGQVLPHAVDLRQHRGGSHVFQFSSSGLIGHMEEILDTHVLVSAFSERSASPIRPVAQRVPTEPGP